MVEPRPQRQLSAILAADVAGYSRLIGLDEEGTLERMKDLRRAVIDPKIGEHRGRIVKTMGDGACAFLKRCGCRALKGTEQRGPLYQFWESWRSR